MRYSVKNAMIGPRRKHDPAKSLRLAAIE